MCSRNSIFLEFVSSSNQIFFITILGIQITCREYRSFQIFSNIMREHPGVFLTSVARHICCGTFIFFGIVAYIGCINNVDSNTYQILLALGAILFFAGFVITVQESRTVSKAFLASSNRIRKFRNEQSKYNRLQAKSFRCLQVKFGWILYTFDQPQFLNFMQFLFDKVLIFRYVYC